TPFAGWSDIGGYRDERTIPCTTDTPLGEVLTTSDASTLTPRSGRAPCALPPRRPVPAAQNTPTGLNDCPSADRTYAVEAALRLVRSASAFPLRFLPRPDDDVAARAAIPPPRDVFDTRTETTSGSPKNA